MRKRRTPDRAFTLVEVLLVLVILVGLGALAVVMLTGSRRDANINLTKAKMQQIQSALEKYKNKFNEYPDDTVGGLQALVVKPDYGDEAKNAKWNAPFIDSDKLEDAWGNEIVLTIVTDESSGVSMDVPQLVSPGPDQVLETDDDIRIGGPKEQI